MALIVKLPAPPLILGVLNNAAHAPVFGALAIVIHQLLQRTPGPVSPRRLATAFALTVAIGAVVELVQPLIGRGAEAADLLNDAFGAIAGLALLVSFRSRRKLAFLVAIGALVPPMWPVADALVAYALRARSFPTHLGEDAWADRYFVHAHGVDVSRVPLPPPWHRDGDPESHRIQVTGTRWPGLTHREPVGDWRGYSRLLVDITNPEDRPLALTLRVHDRAHDNNSSDRYNGSLTLAASQRATVAIPLAEIERAPATRQMDLSRIAGIIIFGDGAAESVERRYYVTRIWLE